MKKLLIAACMLVLTAPAFAQKYMTRTGKVSFYSHTPIENIEAVNNESAAAVDSKTGDVVFQVPIKSFKFEKELMQEHFNENYMESDKFPKAEFRGKLADPSAVNFAKDGVYKTNVTGKLTMHGVTKDITVPGTITVKGGTATIDAKFNIKPADYGIKIPAVVASKIAEQIEVTINTVLKPA
ncbi:YceI family protein [Taibaiella soli]|uniref:YceI family protein n=1 Tax=Taibaiella soli TaxID=1649169 RepID=A0A2W2AB26_9BACT|nr:YceI family protein [Taibaiella soli]PZF70792.1 YceI family protein [Taibaiella soli]